MKKELLKKFLSLGLVTVLVLGMVSCSRDNEEKTSLREAATSDEQSEILRKAKAESKVGDNDDKKDSAKDDKSKGEKKIDNSITDGTSEKSNKSEKSSKSKKDSTDNEDDVADYAPGLNTESDYASEFIGVQIKLPSGYKLESQDIIDEMNLEIASSGQSQYLKYEASMTNGDNNLQLIIASDGHQGATSEQEYTQMIADEYSSIENSEVSPEVRSMEIAGKEYAVIDISLTETNKIKYCIRKKGDEMITFIFMYLPEGEGEIDSLVKEFEPYGA